MPYWLEIATTVLDTLGILAASGAAVWGLRAWRREMVGRRKAELAEEVLTKAYQTQHAIEQARFPVSASGEGESRRRSDDESDSERRSRNALYTPVERLERYSGLFAELEALRFRFIAMFGEDAGKPIQDLIEARNRIVLSAHLMVSRAGPSGTKLPKKWSEWERDIGWGDDEEEDRVRQKVNGAIEALVLLCQPAIQGRS